MANDAWGQLTWNSGLWGQQNDSVVQLTGFGLNTSEGQANYTPDDGWGRYEWGYLGWGVNYANVTSFPSGSQINLSEGEVAVSGEIREGWGNYTWGSVAWGGEQDPEVGLLGQQLNTALGELDPAPDVALIGQQINITTGIVQAFPLSIIEVTGEQLNISQGTAVLDANTIAEVSSIANAGWGIVGWNTGVWGDSKVSTALSITEGEVDPAPDVAVVGQQLNTFLGNLNITGDANLSLIGQQLNISQGEEDAGTSYVAEVSSTIEAGWGQVAWGTQNWGQGQLTINLNIAEGEVDPSPDAMVTGIGMTVSLAVGTVVIGTANVTVTGEQVNLTLNSVDAIPNTLASVTGIGLNIGVGTVFAGGNTDVNITGNLLTVTLNSINNQIWTEINTGTDATWIEIDTAA
jgi:hypothetical protein